MFKNYVNQCIQRFQQQLLPVTAYFSIAKQNIPEKIEKTEIRNSKIFF